MRPLATVRWGKMLSTTVLVALVTVGCGADVDEAAQEDVAAPTSSVSGAEEPVVLSAEQGAAARARFTPLRAPSDAASSDATASVAAESSSLSECGEPYVPTVEELATVNADAQALAAALARYSIEHDVAIDELGFESVEYDYNDVVAQSVADSFWTARYPAELISQQEIEDNIAVNDVIAEQLDAIGAAYTRTVDDVGYEVLDYDYSDPSVQAAVDAAWLIISPPQPPSAEDLAQQTESNAELTAAFDAAGIEYQLVSDEVGWAWVEWDIEDEATTTAVYEVFDELYPPIAIDPIEECVAVDPPVDELAIDEPAIDEPAIEIAPVDEAFDPDELAQRAAEVDALAAGFAATGVVHEVTGDEPWRTVIFDLVDDNGVAVVVSVLAGRS